MYRVPLKILPEEVLVYFRKSRADDPSLTVEEVLEKHEKILQAWIEENLDGPIPPENYYREIISGEDLSNRKEMQRILKRIEEPKIKYVWSVDCQRISRGDLADCGHIIRLFKYCGITVITQYRYYDMTDEYDRENFERELKFGNIYLEQFKKLQRRGVDVSLQSGNYVGANPPYGYNKIKVTVGKKKCPTLEINEDEARVVRMIFDWYGNEGIGCTKIADRLDAMGIKPRFKERWSKESITGMLKNEAYIGKIRFRQKVTTHIVVDQEIIKKQRRREDYEVYDGRHEPIIDEELFYRIQNKRVKHHHSTADLKNPLAGMLYCKCGTAMSKRKAYNRPTDRYVCEAQKFCHNTSAPVPEVLEAVCNALKENIEDFTVKLENDDEGLYMKHEEHIKFLQKKLIDAEGKEVALWEKYTEEGMPKAIFEKLRTKCEEEKKNLESALQYAYDNAPKRIDYEERIARFHEAIDLIHDPEIDSEVKNRFLKTIIKKIEYSRNPSTRISAAEAKEKGIVTVNGWCTQDFELDIHLLI